MGYRPNTHTGRTYREINEIALDGDGHAHAGVRVDALGSTQSGRVVNYDADSVTIINFRGDAVTRPLEDVDHNSVYRCRSPHRA